MRLGRAELAGLAVDELQQREEHWVIADLVGKGGHVRTVPGPSWGKTAVDVWLTEANVVSGPILRAINKAGRIGTTRFNPKVIWGVVKAGCSRCGLDRVAPHDLRSYAECRSGLIETSIVNWLAADHSA
jgi:integrase